ncbi:hypothetical protein R6Q59_012332 [Mikania micrantha]
MASASTSPAYRLRRTVLRPHKSLKTAPRGVYELAEDLNEVGDDDNVDGEHFFQENERIECTINEDFSSLSFVQGDIEEVEAINDDDNDEVEFEATVLADEDFHIILNFEDEDSE